jgi:hypothetical protein
MYKRIKLGPSVDLSSKISCNLPYPNNRDFHHLKGKFSLINQLDRILLMK